MGEDSGGEITGAIIVITGGFIVWALTEGRTFLVWLWYRPILSVRLAAPLGFQFEDFQQDELGDYGPVNREMSHIRVRIKNEGGIVARNCRAWLVGIDEEIVDPVTGVILHSSFFEESLPLVWSYNPDLEAVSIAPGVTFNADVIEFEFFPEPQLRQSDGRILHPRQYQELFRREGTYQYRVQVSSDDANSAHLEFRFRWRDRQLEIIDVVSFTSLSWPRLLWRRLRGAERRT